jgi:hypothetical protein
MIMENHHPTTCDRPNRARCVSILVWNVEGLRSDLTTMPEHILRKPNIIIILVGLYLIEDMPTEIFCAVHSD